MNGIRKAFGAAFGRGCVEGLRCSDQPGLFRPVTSRAVCGIHPAMTARKMTNIMLRQSRSHRQEVYYDQRLSSNRPAGPLDTDIFRRPNFDNSSFISRTSSNSAKSG